LRRALPLVLLLLAACPERDFPIPPPPPSSFHFDVSGCVTTFSADPAAAWADCWVAVRCEETLEGAVERSRDDGSVGPTVPFACCEGHHVLVGWDCGYTQEYQYCVILQDGPSSPELICP
jgi:hypothetical protein